MADAPRPDPTVDAPPRLLARWDSLLLSHHPKRRDRVLAEQHRTLVFSKNADVLPTFLIGGMVAGTWALNVDSAENDATIELRPFDRLERRDQERLVAEAERVLSLLAPRHAERSVSVAT